MAEVKRTLYISGLYSISVDDPAVAACEVVKRGTYGEDRCGGACSWVVTKRALGKEMQFLFCVPYAGQKHFYLYSFYSNKDIEKQKLWSLLEEHKRKEGATAVKGNSVPEYIVLGNEMLDTFDHAGRCLRDDYDWYPVGGSIEYADLELVAWKDVRQLLREMKRPLLVKTGNFDDETPEIHYITLDEKDFESVVVKAIEKQLLEWEKEYGEGSFPQDRCNWWITDSKMKFSVGCAHGSHHDAWTFELENCGGKLDKLVPMLITSPVIRKYSKSKEGS